MIEKQRIEGVQLEEKKVELKLVDGYPPAYIEHLAKLDHYKKIIHDIWGGVKYRAKAYPVVIGEVVSKGARFAYGCSRTCLSAVMSGQIYPLKFRIDGEVDKQIFIGRLGASVIVSGMYGISFLFRSKSFLGFMGAVGSLFVIFGFFQWMGFTEKVQEDSRLWNMWDAPSIVFNSVWFIAPLAVMAVVFGYLGYKKSEDFRGLKHSWNSMIGEVIGKKKRDCE